MRTIKFRAISMCNGEHWVYGDLRHYNHNPHTEKWTIYDPEMGIETDVDEDTIGQFTGLYDIKGQEIYEGDILQTRANFKGVVMWNQHGKFYINDDKELKEKFCEDLGVTLKYASFEVIGNIYDNPELLKGGER